MKKQTIFMLAALLAACTAAQAEIVRHPIPNSTFPIAQSVEIRGNVTTYYISGQVPPVVNKDADPASLQAYGDTRTQSVGVLKMQVFLVHNAAAPMDSKGFMEGYTQFFGGSQPNLPARSVVGVAALANPGFLVEIEVIAVKDNNK